jgi:peptidoglycan/LPS O-acetylase OafA/YrhL
LSQPLFSLQPVVYQGWTLEYEMLFYLAVAIAIAFIKRRNVAIAISGMLVVVAIIGFEWVDWVALEFVFGVIVAFMFRSFALKVIPAVGLICLSIVSMFLLQLYELELERFVIFGIPFALLVWGAASVRQTRHPIAIAAGRDSYAVYLVQVLTIPILGQVLNVVGFLNSSPVISFILILVATQLAGTLFETQFDDKVRAWLLFQWRNHRANS